MAVTDSAVWVRSAADGVFDSGEEVWNLVKVDPSTGFVGDPKPLNGWGILEATDTSLWLTRTGVNSGDLVVEEIDVATGDVTFRGRVTGLGELLTDLSFDVDTRTLWISGLARIERIPLSSIANEITEGPAPAAERFYPPFFEGADGWVTSDSGFVEKGNAATGWASTQPFKPADLRPRSPAIPIETISSLPRDGIVIVAMATPWWYDPAEGAYPDGSLDPLDLSSAIRRGPVAEEPLGEYAVFELTAENPYVGVTVFFGSPDPSAAVLRAAQAELDTLQVPPVCPAPSRRRASVDLSVIGHRRGRGVAERALRVPVRGRKLRHAGRRARGCLVERGSGDVGETREFRHGPSRASRSRPVGALGQGTPSGRLQCDDRLHGAGRRTRDVLDRGSQRERRWGDPRGPD